MVTLTLLNAVSVEKCLCRIEHLVATLLETDEQPLAALGGGGGRRHRADQRGAALHAAMGDVFKIVGCSATGQPGGFDGRKHHPVTALCTGEHEAWQAGLRKVRAVHGTISVPVPPSTSRSIY
jgi:hypothetical protein